MGAGHSHPLHVHGHSVVHRLPAHVKILGAVVVASAVAVTPVGAWGTFAALAVVVIAAVVASRLPLSFLATRAIVVLPFMLSGLAIPFAATGHDAAIGPLTYSSEGLAAGLSIVARSVLGVTVSLVLVGTTELPRLLAGLQQLRVPATLVAIASFLLRYLELVADEFGRMRRAMVARGHEPHWPWQFGPTAHAMGTLFVRSFERGERVHLAMQARAFTGQVPLRRDHAAAAQWALVVGWAGVAAAVAVAGVAA